MADIICRWRNGTSKTVVELVNALPHSSMSKNDFRARMTENWKDDFFKSAYQLACQLGLYYESEEGMYYPRFDHNITEIEAEAYLKSWIYQYYIPNPYTATGSFSGLTKPTYVVDSLVEYVERHAECSLMTACKYCFKEEYLGNLDILRNYIKNYVKELQIDEEHQVDEYGVMKSISPITNKHESVFNGMNRKTFFEKMFSGNSMKLIGDYITANVEERKKMFYDYLVKQGKRQSSCKQYAYTHPFNDVIISIVNEITHKKSLFEVVSVIDIDNIYKKVNVNPVNKEQHHALSATVSNYKKFLDYLESGTIDSSIKYWIAPANNSKFRINDYFQKYDIVDWKQSCNYSVGDIVYLYCSDEFKRILYKTKVSAVDIDSSDYMNDKEYWTDAAEYEKRKDDPSIKYVRLELQKSLDVKDDRLSLQVLQSLDLKSTIQGPMQVPNQKIQDKLDEVFDGKIFEPVEQNPFSIASAIAAIKSSGLIYDDLLIKRFATALLTKPFVILSGLAGSGKTQLALAFAKTLVSDEYKQMCMVPVGADWTNREPLLGYPNALKNDEYVHPESGVLDLLIEANKAENSGKPYFLILDEMNLSYVERYFADFLSAMESHKAINLWNGESDATPKSVELPKNLFIIGTINVDETTYMFSPKVLDRASVIEFKVSEAEMESFLNAAPDVDLNKIEKIDNQSADFVKQAQEHAAFGTVANAELVKFFKELKKVNAEFGYRTATEIGRFISLATSMTNDEAIDSAIVQKLLPKLHGSRKKIVPILKNLWGICVSGKNLEEAELNDTASAKYPLSADKILRMYQSAIDNGFTSFAEA